MSLFSEDITSTHRKSSMEPVVAVYDEFVNKASWSHKDINDRDIIDIHMMTAYTQSISRHVSLDAKTTTAVIDQSRRSQSQSAEFFSQTELSDGADTALYIPGDGEHRGMTKKSDKAPWTTCNSENDSNDGRGEYNQNNIKFGGDDYKMDEYDRVMSSSMSTTVCEESAFGDSMSVSTMSAIGCRNNRQHQTGNLYHPLRSSSTSNSLPTHLQAKLQPSTLQNYQLQQHLTLQNQNQVFPSLATLKNSAANAFIGTGSSNGAISYHNTVLTASTSVNSNNGLSSSLNPSASPSTVSPFPSEKGSIISMAHNSHSSAVSSASAARTSCMMMPPLLLPMPSRSSSALPSSSVINYNNMNGMANVLYDASLPHGQNSNFNNNCDNRQITRFHNNSNSNNNGSIVNAHINNHFYSKINEGSCSFPVSAVPPSKNISPASATAMMYGGKPLQFSSASSSSASSCFSTSAGAANCCATPTSSTPPSVFTNPVAMSGSMPFALYPSSSYPQNMMLPSHNCNRSNDNGAGGGCVDIEMDCNVMNGVDKKIDISTCGEDESTTKAIESIVTKGERKSLEFGLDFSLLTEEQEVKKSNDEALSKAPTSYSSVHSSCVMEIDNNDNNDDEHNEQVDLKVGNDLLINNEVDDSNNIIYSSVDSNSTTLKADCNIITKSVNSARQPAISSSNICNNGVHIAPDQIRIIRKGLFLSNSTPSQQQSHTTQQENSTPHHNINNNSVCLANGDNVTSGNKRKNVKIMNPEAPNRLISSSQPSNIVQHYYSSNSSLTSSSSISSSSVSTLIQHQYEQKQSIQPHPYLNQHGNNNNIGHGFSVLPQKHALSSSITSNSSLSSSSLDVNHSNTSNILYLNNSSNHQMASNSSLDTSSSSASYVHINNNIKNNSNTQNLANPGSQNDSNLYICQNNNNNNNSEYCNSLLLPTEPSFNSFLSMTNTVSGSNKMTSPPMVYRPITTTRIPVTPVVSYFEPLRPYISYDHPPADCPDLKLGFDCETFMKFTQPPINPLSDDMSIPINNIICKLNKFATAPGDVHLVMRFCREVNLNPIGQEAVVIISVIKFLHLARYAYEDILYILATAAASMKKVVPLLEGIDSRQLAYICILQCYLAHCWLEDEACPLKLWHSHLLRSYCSFPEVEVATFRLFKIQNFKVAVTDEELRESTISLLTRVSIQPRTTTNFASAATNYASPPPPPSIGGSLSNQTVGQSETHQHSLNNKSAEECHNYSTNTQLQNDIVNGHATSCSTTDSILPT